VKVLYDQSHYEVLEVSSNASVEEIEKVYQLACATYRDDSLALYSVFDDRDAAAIRDRLDEAYQVLSDAETRSAYDAELSRYPAPETFEYASVDATSVPSHDAEELEGAGESFRELEADVEDESGDFDGAKLRRARLRRGIELDHVAGITKVSTANLNYIEEEKFEELPATVYVRGFVIAYARSIGLDPHRVAPSYLARVEAARSDQGRGRLLGRI